MNTSLITDFSSKSNDPDFPFANALTGHVNLPSLKPVKKGLN